MPYFITDQADGCDGWATVKDDGEVIGCHADKQGAIDQMVAVSLAEDMEPGGERALPDNYRPALAADVPDGRACGNCLFYDESNVQGDRAWCQRWSDYVSGAYYCNAWQADEDDDRSGKRDAGDPLIIVSDFDNTLRMSGGDPSGGVIEHLKAVNAQGVLVVIVTARNERDRDTVTAWLVDHGVPYHDVVMNPGAGDPTAFKVYVAQDLLDDFQIVEWIDDNGDTRTALTQLGIHVSPPSNYRSAVAAGQVREVESRAVDVPGYVRRAAARGLQLRADGRGGAGLTDQTIREARAMANGDMTDDKVIRAAAWAARHRVDLEAPANSDPSHPRWPGPGAVAHYLWGIDPLNPNPARSWLDRQAAIISEQQQEEGRLMPGKMEIRAFTEAIEVRAGGDGMSFTGYAAVFDSPSEPLPFIERIAPGAFASTIRSKNNVYLLRNHDFGSPLARTRNKSMTLTEDGHGLRVEAKLPDTTDGRDLAVLLRDGIVDSMSFGFSVPKNGDVWSDDGMQRTLRSVRLHEVSIVTMPAYRATTASVRSIDRLADVTGLDPDAIGSALDALEAGQTLSNDQADLIGSIVGRLKPADVAPAPEAAPVPDPAVSLDLLRKRLELAAKL